MTNSPSMGCDPHCCVGGVSGLSWWRIASDIPKEAKNAVMLGCDSFVIHYNDYLFTGIDPHLDQWPSVSPEDGAGCCGEYWSCS